jgi:hypothetical protein
MRQRDTFRRAFNISKTDELALVVSADTPAAVDDLRALYSSSDTVLRLIDIAGPIRNMIDKRVQADVVVHEDSPQADGNAADQERAPASAASSAVTSPFSKVLRDWFAIGQADVAFISGDSTFGETAWCSRQAATPSPWFVKFEACEIHRCSVRHKSTKAEWVQSGGRD